MRLNSLDQNLLNDFEASFTSSPFTVFLPACNAISTAFLAMSSAMISIVLLNSSADSSLTLSAPDFLRIL